MPRFPYRSAFFAGILLLFLSACSSQPEWPEAGLSRILAEQRTEQIDSLHYKVHLSIPADKEAPIEGRETLSIDLKSAIHPLVVDFEQAGERVHDLKLDGKEVDYRTQNGHIIIPASFLNVGIHRLTIKFRAGDGSLNRNEDFLYSLFVPDRASHALPVFDQPDLKGTFSLSLTIPKTWKAVANGPARKIESGNDTTRYTFAETPPLPTYLFAFAAGDFKVETAKRDGRTFHMYHRETDTAKVNRNKDAIFDLHARALKWLENYTGIKYPFAKFDFVLIPSFQFGGMEHPGAILYKASSLMLDKSATKNDYLGRAGVISHETSHMWFGDLVTMKWFNDVWTKEVFANFMAAKIVNPSFPDVNHNLRFLLDHYPAAYAVDRTPGANAIRQPLENLQDAGNLYGNIIYHKAPIVMRKLENILGKEQMRDGLREYLDTYRFDNATWPDLIAILNKRTDRDLKKWSHAWVEEAGRPRIDVAAEYNADQSLARLKLRQSDPSGENRLWPQKLHLLFRSSTDTLIKPIDMNTGEVSLTDIPGQLSPDFIIPNGKTMGYGLFELDGKSRAYLEKHLATEDDPQVRAAVWISLWDMLLEKEFPVARFIRMTLEDLPEENNELNTQLVLRYLREAYWRYSADTARTAAAPKLEQMLWQQMEQVQSTSLKSSYFHAYEDIVLTKSGLAKLREVWARKDTIEGLPFSERDYTRMAEQLAVHEVEDYRDILDRQAERITNPDRKARFDFVRPALSADASTRNAFFESLKDAKNRAHEPWVLEGLHYLHHPLRAKSAQKYIYPSLELLKEIQRTGDIFFPKRWLDATFSGHNSEQAALAVTSFLDVRSDYPHFLRDKLLQSSDPVFRAVHILHGKKMSIK